MRASGSGRLALAVALLGGSIMPTQVSWGALLKLESQFRARGEGGTKQGVTSPRVLRTCLGQTARGDL